MIKLKDLLKEDIGTKAYLGGIVQALRRAGIKYKKAKEMNCIKHMKQEVDIGATGTHKYRIKNGPNKGIVV